MKMTEGYERETTNDRIGALRRSLQQIVGRKGLIPWVISTQLDCDFAGRGKLKFEEL